MVTACLFVLSGFGCRANETRKEQAGASKPTGQAAPRPDGRSARTQGQSYAARPSAKPAAPRPPRVLPPPPPLSAPRTIAIVAGDSSNPVPEPYPTLLMSALQQDASIRLVERERLRDALAELKLSIGGLTDPAASNKLGKILSADAFIVLAPSVAAPSAAAGETVRASGGSGKSFRFRVVDARTSLLLDDGVIDQSMLEKEQDALLNRLRASLNRGIQAGGKAKYLGIVDVRSEEVGQSLNLLSRQLRSLLVEDLARTQQLFLLERDDLTRITQEAFLGGADDQLRTATSLLECGIRRDEADTAKLRITLRFRSLVAGKNQRVREVAAPLNEVAAIRKATVEAILAEIALAVPPAAGVDPADEADVYTERAKLLRTYRQYREAAQIADAAAALDPAPDRRRTAYEFWRLATQPYLNRNRESRFEARIAACNYQFALLSDLEAEMRSNPPKKRVDADGRGSSLHVIYYPKFPIQPIFDLEVPPRVNYELPKGAVIRGTEPLSPSEERLVATLRELSMSKYARIVSMCRAYHFDIVEPLQSRLSIAPTFAQTPAELQTTIDECLEAFISEVAAADVHPAVQTRFYVTLGSVLSLNQAGIDRSRYTNHRDLRTRLTARSVPFQEWAFSSYKAPADAPRVAEQTLIERWNGFGKDARSAAHAFHFDSLASSSEWPVRILSKDRAKLARLLDQFLNEAEAAADSTSLAVNPVTLYELLRTLPAAEAEPRVTRIRDLLKRFPPAAHLDAQAKVLQVRLGYVDNQLASQSKSQKRPFPKMVDKPLPVTDLAIADGISWFDRQDDQFIILSAGTMTTRGQTLELWQAPIAGGAAAKIASLSGKNRFHNNIENFVFSMVSLHKQLYFATKYGLLTTAPDQRLQLLGEAEGLPATEVTSAIAWEGRLLLGFNGGLGWYDPAQRKLQMIASSQAVAVRQPLDGGENYRIDSLVPDPARKCVWIGLGKGGTRNGVWKFTPADGKLVPIKDASGATYKGGPLLLADNKLWFAGRDTVMFIDPATESFGGRWKERLGYNCDVSGATGFVFLGPDVIVDDRSFYVVNAHGMRTTHCRPLLIDGKLYGVKASFDRRSQLKICEMKIDSVGR